MEVKEMYIKDIFDLRVKDNTPIKIMFNNKEYFLQDFEIDGDDWFFRAIEDEAEGHIENFGEFYYMIENEAEKNYWSDDIYLAPIERVRNLSFRMGFEENNNWDFMFKLQIGDEIIITMIDEY